MQDTQQKTLSWSQPQGAPAQKPVTPITPVTPPPKNPPPPVKAKKDSGASFGTYVGIFVSGLVVGVLIGWGVTALRTTPSNSSVSQATSTGQTVNTNAQINTANTVDLSGSTVGTANVVVASPQPAGNTVMVSKVQVNEPTWVIVYDDHNGVAGNALGARLFFPASMGGEQSGAIALLRATVAGQKYIVGQSLDDGDKQFSKETDKPVRDSAGTPVWSTLEVQ